MDIERWWIALIGFVVGAAATQLWRNGAREKKLPSVVPVETSGAVDEKLRAAHRHSMRNRSELKISQSCGCFYCEKVFSPAEIREWIDEDNTALCPYCGIDSVLASSAGFELSREFLKRMNEHWF